MLLLGLTLLATHGTVVPTEPVRADEEIVSEFIPLGDLAGGDFRSQADGVSSDGTVVVGASWPGLNQEACLWTRAGGIVGLGDLPGGAALSFANGISGDGLVAVGASVSTLSDGSGNEAFRWVSPGPMTGLGTLLGGLDVSVARRASADGSTIVGTSSSGTGLFHAFVWTDTGGMVGLSDLPSGTHHTDAYDVSADGSIIVGRVTPSNVSRACRWTSPTTPEMLPLPDGMEGSIAFGCDADASVVVGQASTGMETEAFRWVEGVGTTSLGDLPGGLHMSSAQACSADGSVVVGQANTDDGQEAYVWTEADGMTTIRQALRERGVFAAEDWQLTVAMDVSADGTVVVGHGINPNGQTEGWIAVLGEPFVPEDALFPKLVTVNVNQRKPHRSLLKITGQFDCGVNPVDWTAPCVVSLGNLGGQTDVLVPRRSGRTYVFDDGDGFVLELTPSPIGSSRSLFSVTYRGVLDDPPQEGLTDASLVNDAVSGMGQVRLVRGKYKHGRKGALVHPHLQLLSAKAGFSGGRADTLKLVFSLATDRKVPAQPSDLSVWFGDTFAETLPDDVFALKGGTKWVAKGKAPGLTSVVCDYKKEKLTIVGSKLDLGPFVEGKNTVKVRIRLGQDDVQTEVLMIRKKQARKDVLLY